MGEDGTRKYVAMQTLCCIKDYGGSTCKGHNYSGRDGMVGMV